MYFCYLFPECGINDALVAPVCSGADVHAVADSSTMLKNVLMIAREQNTSFPSQ